MRVWLVCFVALFGLTEFYQWAIASPLLEQIQLLPLPVLIGAGCILAIASNTKKHLPWQAWPPQSIEPPQPAASNQPPLPPTNPSTQSISFTIQPPVNRK